MISRRGVSAMTELPDNAVDLGIGHVDDPSHFEFTPTAPLLKGRYRFVAIPVEPEPELTLAEKLYYGKSGMGSLAAVGMALTGVEEFIDIHGLVQKSDSIHWKDCQKLSDENSVLEAELAEAKKLTFPFIRARCPACHNSDMIFVASGNHLTCSWAKCPNPTLMAELVEGEGIKAMPTVEQVMKALGFKLSGSGNRYWQLYGYSLGKGAMAKNLAPLGILPAPAEPAPQVEIDTVLPAQPRKNPRTVEGVAKRSGGQTSSGPDVDWEYGQIDDGLVNRWYKQSPNDTHRRRKGSDDTWLPVPGEPDQRQIADGT